MTYGMRNTRLMVLKDQIIDSYLSGLSLRELADIHNCSHGTIRNFLIDSGVELRSRGKVKGLKYGTDSKTSKSDSV